MALAHANNHLAVCLQRLLSEEKGNVFFSPFSISTALAIVLCAAEGETEAEMKKVLGYDCSKEDIISAFQQQMPIVLENSDFCTLTSANSVLIQDVFAVKDEYKVCLKELFNALLLQANFQSDGISAVSRINDWVKEKTNNMIPELIQSLDPSTVMVLLNSVYFKGSWLQKFDKDSTFQQTFYNGGREDRAKPVDMMRIEESFRYIEKDAFQALDLPYAGDKFAMLILLPTTKDGLEALEKELSSSFVHNLRQEMVKKKVMVNLPRFSLDYSKSLITYFQLLGMNRLFEAGAELGGISDCPNLFVSEVIHKAVLEVNEEGSEAAAATLIAVANYMVPIIPEFIVDHPFAFAIYEIKSQIILFMGRVEEL